MPGPGGALPNLIVIGAQKCGTSALHYYLDLHPEVSMSAPKELNFFIDGAVELHPGGPHEPMERRVLIRGDAGRWGRGLDWYRSHFDPGAAVRGEASPNYTAPWHPGVAELMERTIPEAKLIFCVRDPLEQISSAWMHYRSAGNEPRPFAEAVNDPRGMYVRRARYHERLQPFAERWGMERILIVEQSDLRERRRETISRVFGFCGVDASFWDPRMERERHASEAKTRRARALRWVQLRSPVRGLVRVLPQEAKWRIERAATVGARPGGRPEIGPDLRERLCGWLADDAAALREATGRGFEGWSV